ncbi:MAG: aminotransferase class V-fold PLP-dependent enzyme [Candidatus Sericytochromatia bacterium]|nr:aminotransferase class V-fold PLP-dependent enzyme [Candidatus Sericytochromatia bacterium]
MPSFDLARARRDTPACEQVIHFNNAGAALMPDPVVDAVIGHLQLEAAIGGYEAAERHAAASERMYGATAALIGATAPEIAFLESATRAWDQAFYAIPFRAGDRILTSVAEYASNYIAFLQLVKRTGVGITVIPDDAQGQIDLAALSAAIDSRTRLISLTHMPSTSGLINPAAAVGRIARAAGVLYLLDACQTVGQMDIDVQAIGCDFLSATGRKYLRGPRGTGFLYVRAGIMDQLEPPVLDMHAATWVSRDAYVMRDDARRFETWECSIAGKIGLAVALDYAHAWGMPAIGARVQALAATLRQGLRPLPGVTVLDRGEHLGGIVTLTVDGHDPVDLRRRLHAHGINVSVAKQQATRLDLESRGIESLLRASVHYYNTEGEIERFCAGLAAVIKA